MLLVAPLGHRLEHLVRSTSFDVDSGVLPTLSTDGARTVELATGAFFEEPDRPFTRDALAAASLLVVFEQHLVEFDEGRPLRG